ncbi:MAG TPA: hypothetical protein PK823_04200 [Novosphingobium sp.]|nr:hypothetical protein [Novosphingobium sp.]
MRKITALITTVLMSVQGVPAYAIGEEGSEFYGSSDGWDVYKTVVPGTRNRCELVALTHRHSLLVAFDPIRDALLLGFTIEDGSNLSYSRRSVSGPLWAFAAAGCIARTTGIAGVCFTAFGLMGFSG